MSDYDYIFKIVLVGNTICGKTSIVDRFSKNSFKTDPGITIGVDFGEKIVDINNVKVKFQIWDTAGQETFRTITRSYYSNVALAIIVFDITNKQSLNSVDGWIAEIKKNSHNDTLIVLAGNKIDLLSDASSNFDEKKTLLKEKIEQTYIDSVIKRNNISHYFEVSAKTNEGITHMFECCAKNILNNLKLHPELLRTNSGIKINTMNYSHTHDSYSCCTIV